MAPGEDNISSDDFKKLVNDLEDDIIPKLGQAFDNMTGMATQLNNTFGQSRQRIQELQQAIGDTIPGIMKLGGNLDDTYKTLSEISSATKRNIVASADEAATLYASSKVLGSEVKDIVTEFEKVGVQFSRIGPQLKESINYIQNLGLNTKQIFADVESNMSALNKYNFEGGVQGLTKMASHAAMFKFDMRDTFEISEKALRPEGAIELASAFQRMGVAAADLTDPFQLMNKSLNDPSGLQDSLASMTQQYVEFDDKTKTFQINPMGMLQMRELASQTGLNYQNLAESAKAVANLNRAMGEIQPGIKFETEEDKQLLSNIATMNKEGEYVVNVKNELGVDVPKKLSELTQPQIDGIIDIQKQQGKLDVKDIAIQQLDASTAMRSDLRAIRTKIEYGVVTAPEITSLSEKIRNFGMKSLSDIEGLVQKPGETRLDVNQAILNIKDTVLKAMQGGSPEEISKAVDKLKEQISGVKDKLVEGSQKSLEAIGNNFNQIFLESSNQTSSQINSLNQTSNTNFAKLGSSLTTFDANATKSSNATLSAVQSGMNNTGLNQNVKTQSSNSNSAIDNLLTNLGDILKGSNTSIKTGFSELNDNVKKLHLLPADRKNELIASFKEVLSKYERSPSLGVTLDKDNSKLSDKIVTGFKDDMNKVNETLLSKNTQGKSGGVEGVDKLNSNLEVLVSSINKLVNDNLAVLTKTNTKKDVINIDGLKDNFDKLSNQFTAINKDNNTLMKDSLVKLSTNNIPKKDNTNSDNLSQNFKNGFDKLSEKYNNIGKGINSDIKDGMSDLVKSLIPNKNTDNLKDGLNHISSQFSVFNKNVNSSIKDGMGELTKSMTPKKETENINLKDNISQLTSQFGLVNKNVNSTIKEGMGELTKFITPKKETENNSLNENFDKLSSNIKLYGGTNNNVTKLPETITPKKEFDFNQLKDFHDQLVAELKVQNKGNDIKESIDKLSTTIKPQNQTLNINGVKESLDNFSKELTSTNKVDKNNNIKESINKLSSTINPQNKIFGVDEVKKFGDELMVQVNSFGKNTKDGVNNNFKNLSNIMTTKKEDNGFDKLSQNLGNLMTQVDTNKVDTKKTDLNIMATNNNDTKNTIGVSHLDKNIDRVLEEFKLSGNKSIVGINKGLVGINEDIKNLNTNFGKNQTLTNYVAQEPIVNAKPVVKENMVKADPVPLVQNKYKEPYKSPTTINQKTSTNVDFGGTVTFKVDAPGVNTNEIERYINSQDFKQKVYDVMFNLDDNAKRKIGITV